jgi:hypothetical protein
MRFVVGGIMLRFVSEHILEFLIGTALLAWVFARLYRFLSPFRMRKSARSDRRKTPRTGGRRRSEWP